ncbi:hypothetical protein CP500_021145 [Tychonema bourrellyi FEM_GT703]|uniref:Uncharacterized protein n=1 Tax=Tychonema bourrellyi FEM_GT703 TaxID=2040638 RepID=A0A2G4EVE4_9CYAN|nr:hypothetical protein CP500_021145 [Tychonema bourrellyi FEM_GT703]
MLNLTSEGNTCYVASAISRLNPHKVFRHQKPKQNKDLQSCPVKMFVVVSGCASTIKSVQT